MQINRFKIERFKRFLDQEFSFAPGVNVVYGENEKGKSTLANALLVVLFGDPSTRSKAFFEEYASWSHPEAFRLTLDFSTPKGNFSLIKDFQNRTSTLKNLDNGKEFHDYKVVQEAISKSLGIQSSEIFQSTAFIRQAEIVNVELSRDFKSAVQNAASGAGQGVDVQGVLKKLEADLNGMKVGLDRPAKNPGILKQLKDQIAQVEKNLLEKREKVEKVKTASETKKKSGGRLEEVNEKIELIEKQLDNQKIYDEATQKIKDIDEQTNKLQSDLLEVQRIQEHIKAVQGELSKFGDFVKLNFDEVTQRFSQHKESLKVKTDNLESIKNRIEKTQKDVKETQESRLFLYVGGGMSVVSILISIGVGYFVKNFLISLGLSVVLMIVSAAVSFLIKRYTKLPDKQNELKQLQDEYQQGVSQLKEEEKQMKQLLTDINCNSPDEFYAKKAQLAALKANVSELEATLKGRLGGRKIEDIQKEQTDLFNKKKEIETTKLTEDVKRSKLSPDEYLRKRRELDMLKMEQRRLQEEKNKSEVRVEDAEVSVDDVTELEERLENLQQELEYQEKQAKVLELTKWGIEEALKQTLEGTDDIIKMEIEKYLPVITENRYKEAMIGEGFDIKVRSEERGDFVDPVASLSKGTVDQIYLLVRLAFLKLVAGDKKPPLVLDDPFVTFDPIRRGKTKQILQEIDKERQILLLTCQNDYDDWGNRVRL